MRNSVKVSLVIPAFREEKRLPETLEKLKSFLRNSPYSYEVIVVVEKSPDSTAQIVQEFSAKNPGLIVPILNDVHRGKGFAVKTGVLRSKGDLIFFMDADASTSLSEVERFIEIFERHPEIEVLMGSRSGCGNAPLRSQPLHRRLIGKVVRSVLKLSGLPLAKDPFAGFKAFRGDVGRKLFERMTLNGILFDLEILLLARQGGFLCREEPISWKHRKGSTITIGTAAIKTLHEFLLILRK